MTEGVTEAEAPKDGVIDGVGDGLNNITGEGIGGRILDDVETDGVGVITADNKFNPVYTLSKSMLSIIPPSPI